MEKTAVPCPKCGSSYAVKNGSVANGKKKFLCKECPRQFVESSGCRKEKMFFDKNVAHRETFWSYIDYAA
ncbi:IS1 family transposase [Desulfobulbus sp. F4]|nr:IS1 family transposase [Desulfobulbus sp. F3]MCW5200667.1 IS1 family transposase [Desulfobulbus sp. F4]